MSRYSRPARLLMHSVLLLGVLSSTASVMGTPIPFPLPLVAADYSLGLATVNRSMPQATSPTKLSLPHDLKASTRSPKWARYEENDPLGELYQSYGAASANKDLLSDLASQSSSLDQNDFQEQYSSALSDYSNNVSGFHAVLVKTLSDKGLKNYDRTNSIETILKDFFNLNKGLFNSINDYLPTIPIIGPIVGPIFYNIKCLLDSILDEVEDSADDDINQLQPVLAAILGKMVTKTCQSGVTLAGLCI